MTGACDRAKKSTKNQPQLDQEQWAWLKNKDLELINIV